MALFLLINRPGMKKLKGTGNIYVQAQYLLII